MKKNLVRLFLFLLAAGGSYCEAQAAPSAIARQFSLTAGGFGSLFQPDYGPNRLIGVGAFVDVKITRWIQPEFEGRWLRYNQYADIYQDNYLVGPRVPIAHIWRATPYGKVLFGAAKLNFIDNFAHGTFTDIAYGGGVDVKLTKRLSVRAFDFEYQEWPKWLAGQGQLYPYGASAGLSYRILGGR
jgi:hypothetical protein